jgi:hypothetical protein
MRLKGLAMVERDHESNDKDYCSGTNIARFDKLLQIVQVVATNNLKTLIPWPC